MSEAKLPFIKFSLFDCGRNIFIDVNNIVAVYESHETAACYVCCTGIKEPFHVGTDITSTLATITEVRNRYTRRWF